MQYGKSAAVLAVAAAVLAGCAAMAQVPARVDNGVLVGSNGMTLYTFDKDQAGSGRSACNGQCAANWPPLAAGAAAQPAGDYTIITRDDGARQWAYKGKPLYFWVKDKQPGDKTGDGFNKVWRAARE